MVGRSNDACYRSLTQEPLPLYSENLDIALLWNAKAACTFAIKWFFFHDGVLGQAEAYAPWPHKYRQQVYCARPGYRESLRRIRSLGPRAIKVVRDPFDRAVGGYLSLCTQAAKPNDVSGSSSVGRSQHDPMLRAISRHLRRTVGRGELFTFREWVSFLEVLDLDEADIHVRRQVSACEREGVLPELTVVHVEHADEVLPQLERTLGLEPSDLERLSRSGHHTRRVDDGRFVADERFGTAARGPIPATRSFYDETLLAAVGKLYREDITTYGYEPPRIGVRA